MKRLLGFVLVVCLLATSVQESNARKAKLNKNKLTLGNNVGYRLRVKYSRKKVKWKTSNKKIATVSKKGYVKTKKKGKVTITAKIGRKSLKCKVTVKAPSLKEKQITINRYEKHLLIVNYAKKVKWTSANNDIATISQKGELRGIRQGDTIITAKADKYTLTCKVKVDNDPSEQGSYIHPNTVKVRSISTPLLHGKGYAQGGAIWGSEYFFVSSKADVIVYDFNQNEVTKHFVLDQSEEHEIHCNSVCFGRKYDENDPYPLLYVNAYNSKVSPEGTCFVYRLTETEDGLTSTLVSTIKIGFTDQRLWKEEGNPLAYGNFVVNRDLGKLYVYNLNDKHHVTRFFVFDEPTENDDVDLNKEDLLSVKDLPYFPYIQDNCYKDGKIYIVSGGLYGTPSMLRIISINSMKQEKYLYLKDINLPYEPESIDLYNNKLYLRFNIRDKIQFYELSM